MKKLLVVATIALMTTSAFAKTHMVRMFGWDGGARTNSFDFALTNDGADTATTTRNIALNYAYAVTSEIQVGGTYKSFTSATDGDTNAGSYTTIGLSGYYNLDGDIGNTNYLGLHYNMQSFADDATVQSQDGDTQNDIVLEFGHRWTVGSGWGFDLTYAPSVTYTLSTVTPDGGDSTSPTALGWNFLKADILF